MVAWLCAICLPTMAWAQVDQLFFDGDKHGIWRGPGGYFAAYKLVLIVLAFTGWVILVDWANREALRLQSFLQTKPEVWSPIFLGTWLAGLIAVLAIPIFWAGFPVLLLLAYGPIVAFFVTRNKQVDPELRKNATVTGRISGPMKIVEVERVPIEFLPQVSGRNPAELLILARRLPGYTALANMCDDLLRRRAENVTVICNRETAVVRMQIDGIWHQVAEMDTAMGQGMIAAAAVLVGVSPDQTGKAHSGRLGLKKGRDKSVVRFSATPSKTDYRGQFRIEAPTEKVQTFGELGMPEALVQKVRDGMAGDGFFVLAATPGQGMTTMWKAALHATDRWTRDWYGIVPESDTETFLENIQRLTHSDNDVDAALELIRKVALKQAGGYAIPQLFDPRLTDELIQQSVDEGRKTLTRVAAKSAAEGLLRVYAASANRKVMAEQLRVVVYQRLARKLCPTCRQKQPVDPSVIKRLGGDPRSQDFLFTNKTIPAELPKDYQPCGTCNDLGFVGRVGVFEVLEVTPLVRQTLLKQPKVEAIAAAAKESGAMPLMQSGYPLLLNGVTSLDELKRACSG